jgi:hypothetical protein
MRVRLLPVLAFLSLVVAARPVAADEPKTAGPDMVIHVRSLDGLLDDFKYLAKLVDKEEEAKQFEGILKAKTGEKGLEGLDRKWPLGLYGYFGTGGLENISAVVLIPIADEQAMLKLLDNLNVKPVKGDDGIYTVSLPGPAPNVFFRFANRYAYVTARDKSILAKADALVPPEVIAPPSPSTAFSINVHVDRIPENLKQFAIPQIERALADVKKAEKGESKAQLELKKQVADELASRLATLIRDAGAVEMRVDIDRQTDTLAWDLSLEAKPGSKLATLLADVGNSKSLFGGLARSDSAASGLLHLTLPETIRQALPALIDEEYQKAHDKETDAGKRTLMEQAYKALLPSLKSGELDAAFDLRGPGASKHYTVVAGLKLQEGKGVEKFLRDLVSNLPEKDKAKIHLDAEKVGEVGIHRVEITPADEGFTKAFGESVVYAAFRNDAVLFAAGEQAVSALKDALALEPKAAQPVQLELAVSRLALAMRDKPEAPAVAEKVFGKDKDSDRVRIRLEDGKSLRLHAEAKAKVLQFFYLVNEKEK